MVISFLILTYKNLTKFLVFVGGEFNFQVVLAKDGRIWFSYKAIPMTLQEIRQDAHPVKVGLSDAYYIDTTSPGSSK